MSIKRSAFAIFTLLLAGAAIAQSTNPVAYVYVTMSDPSSSSPQTEILGGAVAPNGAVTAIPGVPFGVGAQGGSSDSMAVNGKFMFGANLYGANINTYTIGSNGALS